MKPYKILPLSAPLPRKVVYIRKLKAPKVPLYFCENVKPVRKMKFVFDASDMPDLKTTVPAEGSSSQDP